jgi:hypothetical protein
VVAAPTGVFLQLLCSQVTRRFPALKYLDRVKLQPVISFDIPTYVLQSVLPPSQPSFFDSPQRQTLAVDFLRKYV